MTRRSATFGIGFWVLIGLVLRYLNARGGLWVDEAWSLIHVQDAGNAWGVLTRINHDNNHHLNSWWMLAMGANATPFQYRILSIVTGSALIAVLGRIGQRHSPLAGVMTAALAAVSPILMTYGSEARGYAPALLVMALMIDQITAWLAASETHAAPPSPTNYWLGLLAVIGAFSHLLMLPAIGLMCVWIGWVMAHRHGWRAALPRTIKLMTPALIGAGGVGLLILNIALHSKLGMRVGGYIPFTWPLFGRAMVDLLTLSSGIGGLSALPPLVLCGFALLTFAGGCFLRTLPIERKAFYLPFILGLPLLALIIHPGNSQYPRYYLTSTLGLTLLLGEVSAAAALMAMSWQKWAGALIMIALLTSALWTDRQIINNQRGHPERMFPLLAQAYPQGVIVMTEKPAQAGVLKLQAAQVHYPIRFDPAPCSTLNPDHSIWLIEAEGGKTLPNTMIRCGLLLHWFAGEKAIGLSGVSWGFYR